jgi:CHASE2 domain-containing sensor protein
MSQLVVLNLGNGDWHQGCPSVTAQLWLSEQGVPMQFAGSLPPAPEFEELLSQWQQMYVGLYAYKNWQHLRSTNAFEIEIDQADVTNVSDIEFLNLCQVFQQQINAWLDSASFRQIDRQLRTRLSHHDEIRFIITSTNQHLLELPWFLWQFFEDYPKAEPAFSLPDYTTSLKTVSVAQDNIKILTILGDSTGIDVTGDRQILEQLPHTELQLLIEPDLPQLTQQLWEPGWDILFFAGHSSSQGQGTIQVNSTNGLTLSQLRYGLKRAIANGLKLAIFNSCDGLKLAWELADLQIPVVIVMRSPVPNRVAQAFLKSFLHAFSNGQPLYCAVRAAREQLQGLEAEFPCATWLPVIYQNPAEPSPRWQQWQEEEQEEKLEARAVIESTPTKTQQPSIYRPSFSRILLSTLAITGLVLGVRSLGFLQPLELWAFDRLLNLRPHETPDSRFLIITVNEADIQAQSNKGRGSLSDDALNQLLNQLEQHQPRVIGLDIYRDFSVSPDYPELATQLQQNDRLIAVCKNSDVIQDSTGIGSPPELPEERLGFSDFLEDRDGVLRRQLISMMPNPASPCTTPYAFSARVAFIYLQQEKILPQFTDAGNLQMGKVVFQRLRKRSSGYQGIDTRGNQVLLNYRSLPSPQNIAPQVSLTQVLNGQITASAIRDRIVLIGVTAAGGADFWSTPYGTGSLERVPGVFLQAQMTSQMISAVLDQRPLLSVWSFWGECLWIWIWAGVGGIIVWQWRSPLHRGLAITTSLSVLTAISLILLISGDWVPLVPSGIALIGTGGVIAGLSHKT